MKHLYIILMLAVVVAIPAILPADSDGPTQSPFGRYKIVGRELFRGDPYKFTGSVLLEEKMITVTLNYSNPDRPSATIIGFIEPKLTETLFEELEINGTIRRKFVLKSDAEAAEEDEDIVVKSVGWVKIRKTQDETYELTLHYRFSDEGLRLTGGGKGPKS
ncbi:hypothetical protein LCGC14_0094920 [marine sediment metagenome]|uniref:Uncharacterized protein n=1 Tax=marine sediment metagenome TaxID=412755 RepID=A0A0F9VEI4_9ZZZZ|nr:hypothetical protein [Phycisphaerae bacterium]